MATRREGRPLKLTWELCDRFVGHIKGGLPMRSAAALEGVLTETIYDWLRRGRRILDEGGPAVDDGDALILSEFSLRVARAIGEFEQELIGRIANGTTAAGDPDWRASLALLRGRFPDRWSETRTIKVENPDDGPKDDRKFDLRGLGVERLETIRDGLKAALVDDEEGNDVAPTEDAERPTKKGD